MDVKELIGITLGTCTLERIIGRGGMGAVFLAQQSRPVRTVAVKVLIPSDNADPDQQRIFLARFRREADTVAKLEHKNILPLYEYEEEVVDRQPLAYLVMPYIRGGTLRERMNEMKLAGRQFDLNTIVSYISQVADALSYAHSLGVVHRDIKPANLLFHQDGRLLLSDFGIVRLRAMPSLTTVGSFLGTAEYASPEQVSAGELDARSDIYSLGIILYELLAGNVPFTGTNPFAVMSKQLNDPVPSIRTGRPDLSSAIESVVKKTLAKRPEDRYQSAVEMANALGAAVSSASPSLHGLRLTGDANNTDLTIPERPPLSWQVPSPANAAAPVGGGGVLPIVNIPPTKPAIPVRSAGGTPARAAAPGGLAPSAAQWGARSDANAPAATAESGAGNIGVFLGAPPASSRPQTEETKYRRSRRIFYYVTALGALGLQLLIFVLLFAPAQVGAERQAVLGVLLGAGINLLALAGIVFTGVARSRYMQGQLRRNYYACLVITLIAPLASGFFINFGAGTHGFFGPIAAYVLLLLSNILTIRQLGVVDTLGEQVEIAPVLWHPAILGALTGLLPLTIILIFALSTTQVQSSPNAPLFGFLGVLIIAFLGSPTPGAMLAVRLSQNMRSSSGAATPMTFSMLLRSSAIAGILMFLGAFLLVMLWSFFTSNRALFFYHFSQPLLALLISAGLLGLIGMLRSMLDAWVYRRMTKRIRSI